MPEIKHRQDKASPEIEYSEIYMPDDRHLGTGSFRTVIKPNAFSAGKAISTIMIQVPVFQISVNFNPSTKEIPTLLGLADGSESISKKTFLFPKEVNFANAHEFTVTFQNWEIMDLSMDGTLLSQRVEGLLPPTEIKHAEYLGRLITNLHTLETSIRDFLLTAAEGLKSSTEHAQNLRNLRVGQSVPLNPFTNYDDLRTLIIKYNESVKTISNEFIIDENIVNLRDAIAHGRVFAFEPSYPLVLLKFSMPKEKQVRVEFNATMTSEWFDTNIKRTKIELSKVLEASRLLTSGKL